MANIVRDVTWLVGGTPLVRLARLEPQGGARLLGKLDYLSPGGSNKDRAVLGMIEHAERSGFLEPGGTIIEASAGDTGFSLAMICAARRYRLVLVMPETVPSTRRRMLAMYGAETRD
jgi:cysteine synthase A